MKRIAPRITRLPTSATPLHRRFAVAMVFLSLLGTSACGFKLRGQIELPPELNQMLIQPHGSPVGNAIIQRLRESQVRLAASPQEARIILRISNESRTSRVTAVDRNGKVLARELRYTVTFDAVAADAKQLVPRQSIDVVRGYDNPDVEVLGKQLESDLIYVDMISDAANRILGQLRAALL